MTIEEIKRKYPDEWVLVGNPSLDDSSLEVFGGVPLYHSTDKREVCYQGKPYTIGYDTFKMVYTGTFKSSRAITSIFSPAK